MREVAAIARCLLCDSYFFVVVDTVQSAAAFRGRAGTRALENLLEKVQEAKCGCSSDTDAVWLRCPTCCEACSGLAYGEWLPSDEETVLSPCRYVAFDTEEAPPLYMNQAAEGKKPKWHLAQGVGPPAVEVDRSRSGRLYKPSLRQFGIDCSVILSTKDGGLDDAAHMVSTLANALEAVPTDQLPSLWPTLWSMCPLFTNFDAAMAVITPYQQQDGQ